MIDTYKVHNLKCWPEPFEALRTWKKTAEFRKNDRDFKVGDRLAIDEWCPVQERYTGRQIGRHITHILSEGFGMPEGYAMLSLSQ